MEKIRLTDAEKEQIANVQPLLGRHFVASSGNVATVDREPLGPGFVGIRWSEDPHTLADEREFDEWAAAIISSEQGPTDFFSSGEDRENLAEAVERWRKTLKMSDPAGEQHYGTKQVSDAACVLERYHFEHSADKISRYRLADSDIYVVSDPEWRRKLREFCRALFPDEKREAEKV